jgi:hypothetical protein
MALLVLSIGFLQNLLDLLVDVLNLLNESGGFVDRRLIMGRFVCVVERGSATSMGPKGWNPTPPEMGYGPVELWRALL